VKGRIQGDGSFTPNDLAQAYPGEAQRRGRHYLMDISGLLVCEPWWLAVWPRLKDTSVRRLFVGNAPQVLTEFSKAKARLDQSSLKGSAATPGANGSRTSPGCIT